MQGIDYIVTEDLRSQTRDIKPHKPKISSNRKPFLPHY